jgi:hypothetical protein
MLGHDGNTVEAIRELIGVPPKIEHVLLAFAQAHPAEARSIEKTLNFRQSVRREFERMVSDGVSVAELPDVEEPESELNTAEEAYAIAQP